MKKAFVELCNNVSMTVLLGLGFISQAANFVRGVTTDKTGVTVVTPKFPDIFNPIAVQGDTLFSTRLNLKKMGPLQFCLPVFQGIHRNPK